MIIRRLHNTNEIRQFESISKDYQDTSFPIDYKYAILNTSNLVKKGAFCRVIELDNSMIAVGLAIDCQPYIYSKESALQQIFYHVKSDLSMSKKIRAFKLFHQEMIKYATIFNIRHCISSSLLDNYPLFLEILRKEGWVIRGPTAVWTASGAGQGPTAD